MSLADYDYFLIEYEHGAGQAYSVSETIYLSRQDAVSASHSSSYCPYLSTSIKGFKTREAALKYQKKHHIYKTFSL